MTRTALRKFTLSLSLSLSLSLFSCSSSSDSGNPDIDSLQVSPSWISQGNIYEVNVRQYSSQGNFAAFANHLPRLKEMGVQTLWFMPIQPIGVEGRKGLLGSYYAISDYRNVNPEFGTMEEWKALVQQIHDLEMKVIIDWVPNHTAPDHPWVKAHPEFYIRDSVTGIPVHQPGTDWTDTRKLDFKNSQLADSMIAVMKYWVSETDIDGFRCDHAQGQGPDFWKRANAEIKGMKKDLLMLAEAEDEWLYDVGFDMSYAWKFFHTMKDVAAGRKAATALDTILHYFDSVFPPNAAFLHFTSNHDENSWNKADYETMPGDSHAPFAVLTQTVDQTVPLIYSGQEVPVLDSISFFYKDSINFSQTNRAPFYKTLLQLRKNNKALDVKASYLKVRTENDEEIFAFERQMNGDKVFVILNLSGNSQPVRWRNKPSSTTWTNVFTGQKEEVMEIKEIPAWGYRVYELKK